MSVTILQIAGIIVTLIMVLGVSLYSGKKVSGGADFATGGGGGGSLLVCSGIMGIMGTASNSLSIPVQDFCRIQYFPRYLQRYTHLIDQLRTYFQGLRKIKYAIM